MPNWGRRERVTRTTEFTVAKGADAKDFDHAWYQARQEWERIHGEARGFPDNWCCVDADDEDIIIRLLADEQVSVE